MKQGDKGVDRQLVPNTGTPDELKEEDPQDTANTDASSACVSNDSAKGSATKSPSKKRERQSHSPSSSSIRRTPYDILCGRGIPIQNYHGNIRLHTILDSYRDEYLQTDRRNKPLLIRRIVAKIKEGGARFLKRKSTFHTSTEDPWEEMDDAYAYEKVSHALRCRRYADNAKTAENESPTPAGSRSDKGSLSPKNPSSFPSPLPVGRNWDHHAERTKPNSSTDFEEGSSLRSFLDLESRTSWRMPRLPVTSQQTATPPATPNYPRSSSLLPQVLPRAGIPSFALPTHSETPDLAAFNRSAAGMINPFAFVHPSISLQSAHNSTHLPPSSTSASPTGSQLGFLARNSNASAMPDQGSTSSLLFPSSVPNHGQWLLEQLIQQQQQQSSSVTNSAAAASVPQRAGLLPDDDQGQQPQNDSTAWNSMSHHRSSSSSSGGGGGPALGGRLSSTSRGGGAAIGVTHPPSLLDHFANHSSPIPPSPSSFLMGNSTPVGAVPTRRRSPAAEVPASRTSFLLRSQQQQQPIESSGVDPNVVLNQLLLSAMPGGSVHVNVNVNASRGRDAVESAAAAVVAAQSLPHVQPQQIQHPKSKGWMMDRNNTSKLGGTEGGDGPSTNEFSSSPSRENRTTTGEQAIKLLLQQMASDRKGFQGKGVNGALG